MPNVTFSRRHTYQGALLVVILSLHFTYLSAQTPAFPGAEGFGRFAPGARGVTNREVYIVTNLNDTGAGSFREAVSKPGRIVVFAIGGVVNLVSEVQVSPNVTIAGQTAPGEGFVLFNKRVTFTGASNTICRYLRIRLGAANNAGKDASGLANGANMIFDHMSFTWGMDEVFSINWDNKATAPDSITIQNCIIGQGLHRENHSAGGLIQTPDGGKVSLLRNLYISNKTRNPKVKGVNEFVNNVVYNWGNGNRLGDNLNYGWSGDAYIMGGSAGVSEVNIINNYFMGGPLTPPDKTTPFSRGTGTFYLYGAGNYFDNNTNGILDGTLVPYDTLGYPGIAPTGFRTQPFAYPQAAPAFTAQQAYAWVCDSVGACYPRRDEVDSLLVAEVRSRGTQGWYVYRESDLPFSNGGVGTVLNAPPPLDTDSDGMPDVWEDAHGLNKNNKQDAVAFSTAYPQYLNIEVYINSLPGIAPPDFVKAPTAFTATATSVELPAAASTITLQWTDNETKEDYFILERSADSSNFTTLAQLAANIITYTDSAGLLPNTTYYYRITTIIDPVASAWTSLSVKTPPIPAAPVIASSPSPANGSPYAALNNGTIRLTWTGSSNTVTYAVYFGTDAANLVKKTELPYTINPAYEVTGLAGLTTYYWRIDAINAKGIAEGQVWSFRTTRAIPAGLAGYWSFDETDGRQVIDSSIYENDGVLGLDDDATGIRIPGKINNALDFTTARTDLYVVSIPHADQLYLDKGSFSLSFWMKAPAALMPPDNSNSAYLLCKGSITRNATTGATGKRFDIEFKNKQFRFALDDDNDANGGGKDELQADGTPFFTNRWVHIVVIRDTLNKKLQLYRNGIFVKEAAISKAKSGIGETSALVIGNIGELEFLTTANKPAAYRGMLDELRIYNYALPVQEITTLFKKGELANKATDPQPVNGTTVGYGAIDLRWKGRGENYAVYTGTSPDSLTLKAAALTTTSFLLTGITSLQPYYWRVDAVRDGDTVKSDVWTFTVVDTVRPVVHTKNITVSLDSTGHAAITPADIDNGSSDTYGIQSRSLSQSAFTCADIGTHIVMLTVTDSSNNSAAASAAVTVTGALPLPSIAVNRTNFTYTGSDAHTIYLGYGAQQLQFKAKDTSTATTFTWLPATALNNATVANPVFSPVTPGNYTYTVTATNRYGCRANASVTAKVIDARCGDRNKLVSLCYNGHGLCSPRIAVPLLLWLGWELGPCQQTAARTTAPATAGKNIPLMVAPNPVQQQATIAFTLPTLTNYQVEVYNAQGVLVNVAERGQASGAKVIHWNAGRLPNGIYFVKVTLGSQVSIQRILVQH